MTSSALGRHDQAVSISGRKVQSFSAAAEYWQRVRRHAVAPEMITAATGRRQVGDWQGACKAARVDVTIDLTRFRQAAGRAAALALVRDLKHLVPELLHWHAPRSWTGFTGLRMDTAIVLARYGDWELQAGTPAMQDRAQRLTLSLCPGGSATVLDWTNARYLWDDRHTDELRWWAGGDATRTPFFHPDGTPLTAEQLPASAPPPGPGRSPGSATQTEWALLAQDAEEVVEAFSAGGFTVESLVGRTGPRFNARWELASAPVVPTRLAELAASAGSVAQATVRMAAVRLSHRSVLRLDLDRRRLWVTATVRPGPIWAEPEALTRSTLNAHWRRPPDLDLLRLGWLTPQELHPLVRRALFPAWPGPDVAVELPEPAGRVLVRPARVSCGPGPAHRVYVRDGRLKIPHDDAYLAREDGLAVLGGSPAGCARVRQTWLTGTGPALPERLAMARRELLDRFQHGDTVGVLRLLDAGMDPMVRDTRGRSLLHLLYLVDHQQLLGRLLAAGLEIDARDPTGLTPFHTAICQGGSVELIRALLNAGAKADFTGIAPHYRWDEFQPRGQGSLHSLLRRRGQPALPFHPWEPSHRRSIR